MKEVSRSLILFLVFGVFRIIPGAIASQSSHDEYVSPATDWPLIHGDWTNQRYSTLTQINSKTVKNLGGAWRSKKFDDGASTRSALVVKNGVMFVNAGMRVYALNAKTGERVWTWDSKVPPSFQGVAVGGGRVFVGLTDGHVV